LRYAKAIVAAVTAGSAALGVGLQDGALTVTEILAVVGAVFGGLGITYAVPNKPPTPPTT
jgi:hypothetical protein